MSTTEHLDVNHGKLEHALRSIGYSFEVALADVIDNSIDAGAQNVVVRIVQRRRKPLDLVVWDDGRGMAPKELREAMRFGANPEVATKRLGKFGLGLKLASLSQARELRVISCKDGELSGRGWLEDGIAKGFSSTVFNRGECQKYIKDFVADRPWRAAGTLVCWSHLYRIGHLNELTDANVQKLHNRLKAHLALAFHRFLEGSPRKVAITIESYDAASRQCGIPTALQPLNPFKYITSGNPDYPCRMQLKGEYADRAEVVAHIWTPNSDSPNYKLPGGSNQRQGFYFYRNHRLIQGGGWNGLREVEPHSSLARIVVDLSEDLDLDLSLDVKKVEIQLPQPLAEAIRKASGANGHDFKKYLALADEAYRKKAATEAELPLIPSRGLPAPLSRQLHKQLKIKKTRKHRDLQIGWAPLSKDKFFEFDRREGHLWINRAYRKRLLHGLPASQSDLPVMKCLLFLLLQDVLTSQRTGPKDKQRIDMINSILVEAVAHERIPR